MAGHNVNTDQDRPWPRPAPVKLKGLFYLLVLLLLSAGVDDTWACATSDSFDDALTARNNDYVSVRLGPPRDVRECDLLPDGFAHQSADLPLTASPRDLGLTARARTPSGPDLLYVFMSLQC
jgi:hypothetical protein